MADENTSLPVRTETAGDVDVFLSDALTPAQKAEIDADRDLHVKAKLRDDNGDAFGTAVNPVNVNIVDGIDGDPVADYNASANLAAGATANHDYTVTALKTFLFKGVEASSSGKASIEIQIETGVGTGLFTSHGKQFNSTAKPDMDFEFKTPMEVPAGVICRVIQGGRENPGQSVYSTIMGTEI